MRDESSFLLFSGSSHPQLTAEVASCLGAELGKVKIDRFPDGEIAVQVLDNVRGKDVFVFQSIARRPNEYLMELLIVIDALKRASAKSIVAVIPYYGYARQDRKDKPRVPITAKLVADLLQTAGITRLLTVDLHAEQLQGFFNVPVDHLYARALLVEAVKQAGLEKSVVVAPDVGSIKMARSFAEALDTDLAIVDKHRVGPSEVRVGALIGDVEGRDVLLVDDMCSTATTLKKAAKSCQAQGAKNIGAVVTHALMTTNALEGSAIKKMIMTNTIAMPDELSGQNIQTVSIAPLIAKAVESIVLNQSISSLFNGR